jgi:hypothetical protein
MKAASTPKAILVATALSLLGFQAMSTQLAVAQSAKSRTIKLTGTRTGTAVFQATGANKTRVTLKLDNPGAGDTYTASIASGACSDPGPTAYQLNQLQKGASTTDLTVSFSTFSEPAPGGRYAMYAVMLPVACGDFAGQGAP